MPSLPKHEADTLFFGGPDFDPVDSPSWRRARSAGRTAYYRELSRHLDAEHQAQTLEGRDRRNVFLRRLKRKRRGDYEGAPGKPLSPWRELSKVNKNRRWRVSEKGCRLYWLGRREKISVQRVLFAHARRNGEFVRGAPTRDVLGIAPRRVERAVKRAREWWDRGHPQDRIEKARPKAPKGPEMVGGVDIRLIPPEAREKARRYPFLAKYLVPPSD